MSDRQTFVLCRRSRTKLSRGSLVAVPIDSNHLLHLPLGNLLRINQNGANPISIESNLQMISSMLNSTKIQPLLNHKTSGEITSAQL